MFHEKAHYEYGESTTVIIIDGVEVLGCYGLTTALLVTTIILVDHGPLG